MKVLDDVYNVRGADPLVTVTISGPKDSGQMALVASIIDLLTDEDNQHAVVFNRINGNHRVEFYVEDL